MLHREKKGVNRQNILVFIIGFFGLIGFLAPFSHVVFNKTNIEGIFGFSKMSSFLFAVGFPILAINAGFILDITSRSIMDKHLSKILLRVSFLFYFVGLFFLTWALAPSIPEDFPPFVYYFSMIIISLFFLQVIHKATRYINNLNEKISALILLCHLRKRGQNILMNDSKHLILPI